MTTFRATRVFLVLVAGSLQMAAVGATETRKDAGNGASRRCVSGPCELWHFTLEDTIETTGRAFLGPTLRCARRQEHEYDPVTCGDYDALYGIFTGLQFLYAGSEEFQSKQFPRAHFTLLMPADEAEPLCAGDFSREEPE